ncbi:MAG: hypothetical protein IJJ47_04665 [Methanosphaera sp.]|nr:hypothetical protein [Methanosphaera sp.]
MLKTKYLVIFLAFLVLGMTVAVAADVDDSTSTTKKVTKDTTKIVKNTAVTKKATKTTDKKTTKAKETTKKVANKTDEQNTKTVTKKNDVKNVKTTTYGIDNSNFDTYFTSTGLGPDVQEGDTLNFTSNVSRTLSNYTVDKPVNINGNGYTLDLNTVYGYNLPSLQQTKIEFNINASNSNITNLKFHNTQVFTTTASNITFDHINSTVENQGVGMYTGFFAMRDGVINITVKNSHFYAVNNTGCSSLVITYGKNCTIDNNTVFGTGNVGNLVYINKYNGNPNNANGINNSSGIVISNNVINATDVGGVCYALTITGANHTIENNNISNNKNYSVTTTWSESYEIQYEPGDTHNISYFGHKYINNNITGKFSTGNYSIVENNWINGTSTIVGNSNVTNNTFLANVTLHNDIHFHSNIATGQTVTIAKNKKNTCIKNSTIGTLSMKSGTKPTYNCTGNTITFYDGLSNLVNCNGSCPCCQQNTNPNNNLPTRITTKNIKTEESEADEGQNYTTTYNNVELVYTVYKNGTLVLHIDKPELCQHMEGGVYHRSIPIPVTQLGVDIKNIVIDLKKFNYIDGSSFEGGFRTVRFTDENVDYKSIDLKFIATNITYNLGTVTLGDDAYKSITYENFNFILVEINPDNDYKYLKITDNVILRNCSIKISIPDGCENIPLISIGNREKYTGLSSSGIVPHYGNNVLIEDCNIDLAIARPDERLSEQPIRLNGFFIEGDNVTLRNNEILVTSVDKDDGISANAYDYAVFADGENFTFVNNTLSVNYVRSMYINSTNSILEYNTILATHDDTVMDIPKSGNTIRYNLLTNADNVQGDLTINNTGDNVIMYNQFTNTELKVISPSVANYNESVPITIILKDKETGKLIAGQDILVIVGDNPAETVNTDDSGMVVYNLTSTTPGALTVTIKCEGNKIFNESTETIEITVGEDKDAIIADLNKTVQEQNQTIASQEEEIDKLNNILDEQDTQIESLENTAQALNNTVSQLEEDLTQAQEQLANNNNTNTNGTSSNNDTSNTNTTTTPTKTSVTIKLNPTTIYTGSKTKITATLKDANGKAVASQKITLKVGSKTYTVKTNNKGVATKTVKVTKTGKNKVTATFKATKKYAKATKTSTLTVKAKEKTKITVTKLSYKNKKITIKATIKAGKKALTQNTKLTIKVDGKTLTAKKTSKKGKITLTLKKALKKGSHKVQIISKTTSIYKEAKITKTLKA